MYNNDGHTALDSKVSAKADTPDLSLVLVGRSLDDGKEDLVVHASSNVFGPTITSLVVLQGLGFQINEGACPFSGQRPCLYKIFAPNTEINLKEMVTTVSGAVLKIREVERLLNNCGWSIFREHQRPIKEGHRAAQKNILKTKDDDKFNYVMTYIKEQSGSARFVTHYIPKQGPDYPPDLLAVIEFLELKSFDGCPESSYRQCFYYTLDGAERDDVSLINRPADKAHKYFDNLETDFGKACGLLIGIDSDLRNVGLPILDIKYSESATVISLPGNKVPEIAHLPREGKEGEKEPQYIWDVFISHATEDKDTFVRQLATELRSKRLQVWYDEFTLRVGDSLRRSIDKGLVKSRYGIVILSSNFFGRKWPEDELNGLAIRERKGEKVILPVWLDVDADYIAEYSPILADRFAAKASDGMNKVISDLLAVIRPNS
ncbi:hypothetical protein ES703_87233 [subsurface metagenome]